VSAADEVAALRGTRHATFRDLVTHPQFSKLLASMSVSALGDWVGFVAVTSLVARLGDTPRAASYAVAGLMIARILPSILFGPIAAVLADRLDRRILMQAAHISRGALYAVMPFIGVLWGIIALSFVIECLSLVWGPARDAMIPNLVPRRQLANANSLTIGVTYGTLPLGAVIFTILAGIGVATRIDYLQENPEFLPLWVDAGTFLFSAYMVSRIEVRSPGTGAGYRFKWTQAWDDVREGVHFLREHSLASAMTFSIVLAFAGVGSVISLGPVFAAQVLDSATTGWGLLAASLGIGMALGMGLVNLIARYIEREMIFPMAMVFAAVTLFVLASTSTLALAAPLTGVMGFFVGTTWVTGYTLLQENVADEYRGRTFGALTILARFALFLSLASFPLLAGSIGDYGFEVFGVTVDLSGVRLALWFGGAIVVFGAFSARRGLRRYRVSKPHVLSLRSRVKVTPRRGVFIAFEGVEGAGKGTQIRLAREYLESEGFEVLVTREPGGTDIGEELRRLLLAHGTGPMEPRTEALLFAAARAQHVSSVIRPALEDGKVVLCDRYIDSSVAYQGVARGLGEPDVLNLNVWATQGLFPDFVILLHIEPELGLLRASEELDRIEVEESSFHAKVADAFLRIAEEHPERFAVVDASRTPDVVHADVAQALLRLLRDRGQVEPEDRGPAVGPSE
jgi:dTMP kinase